MEKIIKLELDTANSIKITDDLKSSLKNLFSGCLVNFLLGAGFSANILGLLNNNEILFESVRQYRVVDNEIERKLIVLKAYLYWDFFLNCIYPISEKVTMYDPEMKPYKAFGDILYRMFSEKSNPALDRQFNIFTTNYDPIIELLFDDSLCICNDGFEGRIYPRFSTDNFSKSYYRQAVFSNRKTEIPSVNLVKIHGSVTWALDIIDGGIEYQDYRSSIRDFHKKYSAIFDDTIAKNIKSRLTATASEEATKQLSEILNSSIFDSVIGNYEEYKNMLLIYKSNFLIVNPTKEKFSDTLLNKNYYELLRIFSNELEKENTLLVVNGFSFNDEHILDLVKRSMLNPSLKILIFCFEEKNLEGYEQLLSDAKNNNITYLFLKNDKLSLERMNEILACIRT